MNLPARPETGDEYKGGLGKDPKDGIKTRVSESECTRRRRNMPRDSTGS